MKRTIFDKPFFLLTFLVFFLCSCGESEEEIKKREVQTELENKYKCNCIEDCLSKFEFEGSRAFLGISFNSGPDEEKIVNAESQYWVGHGDFKKAMSIVDECSRDDYFKENLKYKLISAAIDNLIEKRDWTKAKEYALKALEAEQQDLLLEKIEKAKKVLLEE